MKSPWAGTKRVANINSHFLPVPNSRTQYFKNRRITLVVVLADTDAGMSDSVLHARTQQRQECARYFMYKTILRANTA